MMTVCFVISILRVFHLQIQSNRKANFWPISNDLLIHYNRIENLAFYPHASATYPPFFSPSFYVLLLHSRRFSIVPQLSVLLAFFGKPRALTVQLEAIENRFFSIFSINFVVWPYSHFSYSVAWPFNYIFQVFRINKNE